MHESSSPAERFERGEPAGRRELVKTGREMADSLVAGWLSEIGLESVIPTFREVR